MKKYKNIITITIFIALSSCVLFFVFEDTGKNVTEQDIKNMIQKEHGISVDVIRSYETVIPLKDDITEIGSKKDRKLKGRWAKVRTKGENPTEFIFGVMREYGGYLRIIGDTYTGDDTNE